MDIYDIRNSINSLLQGDGRQIGVINMRDILSNERIETSGRKIVLISSFLKNGLTDGKIGFEYMGIPAGIFLVLSGIVAIIAGLRSSREDAE